MNAHEFPAPDAVAAAHSDRLQRVLSERVRDAGGFLSFCDYMNGALYEPGLGYYMAGAAKFGERGDFTTAPEVSPLFGKALAAQIVEVLDNTGGSVLELGAGSGKLALSIIEALIDRPAASPSFTYSILEPSAELAQRQKQLLEQSLPAQLFEKVCWLTTLPTAFTGVIVANEVMDALPVERFRVKDNTLYQLGVTEDFTVQAVPASGVLHKAFSAIEADLGRTLPEGYESEICTRLSPWIQSLAQALESGVLLLVDYGYPRREFYAEERNRGTLACYYQHRAHDDPFFLPGIQDITAHVDFTGVVEAGVACNLDLLGYASQSAFLLDNDILDLADTARQKLDREVDRIVLAKGIKTLTLPGEMGERFQVMALGKRYDQPMRGFRTQDLAYRL